MVDNDAPQDGHATPPQEPTFEIPADYKIEPELLAPLPRAIPDSLRRHPTRLAARAFRRNVSIVALLGAVVSFIFRKSAFFVALGLYFPPLAHLEWVSPIIGLLTLFGIGGFSIRKLSDPFLYLREGIPVVGQVVDLRKEVATRVNGADSTFAYDVYLQFLEPGSGEVVLSRLRSAAFGGTSTTLNCRVGDFLTALYLPGDLSTLTLYGFTGADPDKNLLTSSKPSAAKVFLAVIAFFGALGGMIWVINSYSLVSGPSSFLTLLGIGAVLGAILALQRLYSLRRRQRAEQEAAVAAGFPVDGETHRRLSPFLAAPLGAMGGTFLACILGIGANGLFDSSAPQVQPVSVQNILCTTHNFVFSTYEVEYTDPSTGKTEKISASPLELNAEGQLKAELLTYPGALGWPWQRIKVSPLTAEEAAAFAEMEAEATPAP